MEDNVPRSVNLLCCEIRHFVGLFLMDSLGKYMAEPEVEIYPYLVYV